MYSKDQVEEHLRAQAKNAMFERDFLLSFNKHIVEKRNNATKTYAETRDWKDYRLQPAYQESKPFQVEGDDKFKTLKFTEFLKDCAFYYDKPTIQEKREMRFNLQAKYDDILEGGWRPPLESRKQLLTWACEQQNHYLEKMQAPQEKLNDCSHISLLLSKYGPDYNRLKSKLGYVRGLFEEGTD